ncbi:MAG: hypothetical protein H0Z24_09065 [Thermosipho sp. (in: Bacteria)]|nr:hypothetical protein [Thermosipho sp. (in: thermotogales)]
MYEKLDRIQVFEQGQTQPTLSIERIEGDSEYWKPVLIIDITGDGLIVEIKQEYHYKKGIIFGKWYYDEPYKIHFEIPSTFKLFNVLMYDTMDEYEEEILESTLRLEGFGLAYNQEDQSFVITDIEISGDPEEIHDLYNVFIRNLERIENFIEE